MYVEERIKRLENVVNDILSRLPCTHNFPTDEDWGYDGESEYRIYTCRNCGEKV